VEQLDVIIKKNDNKLL